MQAGESCDMADMLNLSGVVLNSLEEGCRELGSILGLDKPVELPVLVGALRDTEYANNLLICRNTPPFLKTLLDSPPEYNINDIKQEKVKSELLIKASSSLARWAKTGFSIAGDEIIAKRRAACVQCPNLRAAPDNIAYKVINATAICSLCGCDVERKTRLSSESCPCEDGDNPGYSRWGEKQ